MVDATVEYNEIKKFEKIYNYYKNTVDKKEKKRDTWDVDTMLPLTVIDDEEKQLGDDINILPGYLILPVFSDDISGHTFNFSELNFNLRLRLTNCMRKSKLLMLQTDSWHERILGNMTLTI